MERRQRINVSIESSRGIRHQSSLELLVGRLYNQHSTTQRLLMQRRRMQQLMDSRSDLGPHCWRGVWKRGLTKASITISPFQHFENRISPLVCFTISPCELVCILCTISAYLLHHFTITRWSFLLLHHLTTVFNHFTMWTCVYSLQNCTVFVPLSHHTKVGESVFCYTISPFHH